MNKNLFSLIFVISISFAARAQYGDVNDANFATWLYNNGYSSVMRQVVSQWQIDTTSTLVLGATSLPINTNSNITKLVGLRYFKHLDTLIASGCQVLDSIESFPDSLRYINVNGQGSGTLPRLPPLPATLTYLDCGWNYLTSLPPLPATLQYLNVSITILDSLPVLPASLQYLSCFRTLVHSVPALPAGLQYLICWTDNLTGLLNLPSSLVYLDCHDNAITGLSTLPSSLDTLICSANAITSIPALPAGMHYLDCGGNYLTTLPTLPASLGTLACSANYIHMSLPGSLPSFLQTLNCGSDSLTTLPPLPASLVVLNCGVNFLTSLPALPTGLKTFNCQSNRLTAMPTLPDSLTSFVCSFNAITSIPNFPAGLTSIDCSYNLLDSVPAFPPLLGTVNLDSNHLTRLPPFPAFAYVISCSHNRLTTIGPFGEYAFPNRSWFSLDASYNQLTSISPLPIAIFSGNSDLFLQFNQLTSLPAIDGYNNVVISDNPNLSCIERLGTVNGVNFGHTSLTCVPNYFTYTVNPNYYPVDPNSLPLCTPVSGCPFYFNIAGNAHKDTLGTCLADSIVNGTRMPGVKLLLTSGGNVLKQTYTTSYGLYSVKTDSIANYSMNIDTAGVPFTVECPGLGGRYAPETPADSVFLYQDFGLRCKGVDNGVYLIQGRFRPAEQYVVTIDAQDQGLAYGITCANHSSGTLTTTFSGPVQYISPAAGALTPAVSGPVLTYTIADFNNIAPGAFDIIMETDTNAVIGSGICISAAVFTAGGVDINPSNDALTQCFTTVNSFDPNMKTASPATTVDTGSQWINYRIDFQNTGTDTAYTVIVRDTLSAYLDPLSFQFLASSHKVLVDLTGSAIAFIFPKIDLVDSLRNEPLSHGWLQYKVKTLSHLPVGTLVKNTASIYFDLNPAVVTNTTVNTVQIDTVNIPTGINPAQTALVIRLHPNPNTGTFTLETSGAIGAEYTITDMIGRQMGSAAITADRQTIDVPLSPGVYQVSVHSQGGAVSTLRYEVVR